MTVTVKRGGRDDSGKGKGKRGNTSGVHARKLPDGKGHSSVVRDERGIPQADPPRNKSMLGKVQPPPTEDKPHLEKEKYKGQVEILLLKGVTSATQVSSHLGIAYNTARRYIEEIYYRWAVLGGPTRMRQVRGEARARLDLLTSELWMMFQNNKDDRTRTTILTQLLGVHDRRMILDGLTPTMLQVLVTQQSDEKGGVDEHIRNHEEMVSLATALSQFAARAQEQEIYDGEFSEVESDGAE